MLALLLVNTDDFRFVLPLQLPVAVILRCVADRITNKNACIKLTIWPAIHVWQ